MQKERMKGRNEEKLIDEEKQGRKKETIKERKKERKKNN